MSPPGQSKGSLGGWGAAQGGAFACPAQGLGFVLIPTTTRMLITVHRSETPGHLNQQHTREVAMLRESLAANSGGQVGAELLPESHGPSEVTNLETTTPPPIRSCLIPPAQFVSHFLSSMFQVAPISGSLHLGCAPPPPQSFPSTLASIPSPSA